MNSQIESYAKEHNLKSPPNVIRAFFKYQPDHEIEQVSEELEKVINDLGNTRDKFILSYINTYPILSVKAHTRPFERKVDEHRGCGDNTCRPVLLLQNVEVPP